MRNKCDRCENGPWPCTRVHEWEQPKISPAVEVQQERVALLRGLCGQLAAALRDVRDNSPPGTTAHSIAEQALTKYEEAA